MEDQVETGACPPLLRSGVAGGENLFFILRIRLRRRGMDGFGKGNL